ncbi:MAG: hypothetical protein J6S40_03905 [Thermoguttaceae bacterium]|nr:hypothetical protein [Thermoguttaceae bacterium]
MKKMIILLGLVSFLMSSSASVFAEDVAAPDPAAGAAAPETAEEVPPPPPTLAVSGVCAEPDRMMYNDLIVKIDVKRQQWRERYESVKTEDDIAAYQRQRREFFYEQLGEMWGRTPLNAQVTGVIDRPEYRAEKIVLETLPHFYATGTLFLPRPEKFAPPYPGVLVVCGHSFEGKASNSYQGLCVLGAMNGLAMYIQDPVDQGERLQHFDAEGNPKASTTESHSLAGIGSILLGRNTATYEVWDMIRGLDFLQSRPDVISDRLGVAGNSGGGTQSSYLMALDDRVLCAAPSCYLCSLYGAQTHKSTPQDAEQNIFGQLGFGMDHADYIIMRAPKPTLLNTKTGDFFNIDDTWASFRDALRIYSRQEHSEALSIVEIEGDHGYCPELLDASISWMLRWLAGRDERIVGEYPLPTLSLEEIKSVPNGVMALPEARTTYDINRDYNAELKERRRAKQAALPPEGFADLVRATAKIRPLAEIPPVEPAEVPDEPESFVLKAEGLIGLPIRRHTCGEGSIRLIVTQEGNRSAAASDLAARLKEEKDGAVWSVEPRGWGESRAEGKSYYNKDIFGPDGTIWYLAYLLGETYVGLRAEDVVSTARYLGGENAAPIELTADTPDAALVALHAAAVEPELFSGVVLIPSAVPGSWADYVDRAPRPYPLQNVIHGVLRNYDVEDLMRITGCTVRE